MNRLQGMWEVKSKVFGPVTAVAVFLLSALTACGESQLSPTEPGAGGDGEPPEVPAPPTEPDDPPVRLILDLPDTVQFFLPRRMDLQIELTDSAGTDVEPRSLSYEIAPEGVVGAWQALPDRLALVPLGNGTATVIVTASGDTAVGVDTLQVVIEIEPEELELNRFYDGMLVGEQSQLSLTVLSEGVEFFPVQPPEAIQGEATWKSSDPAVAAVDGEGRVTGLAAGKAVITASWDGLEAATPITVWNPLSFPVQRLPGPPSSGPGIERFTAASDGRLYYLVRHYRTYELFGTDPTGAIAWGQKLSGPGRFRAAPDGRVIYLDEGIHARKPNGELLWENANCSRALGLETGPAGAYCWLGPQLQAIGSDGRQLWSYVASGLADVNAERDDRVYLAGESLIAMDLDGNVLASTALPGKARNVIIGPTGTLFVALENGGVSAVRPDGGSLWHNPTFKGPIGVTPDGDVIATSPADSSFVRINGNTGQVVWTTTEAKAAAFRLYLAIGDDGRLYVVSGSNIFAFDLATGRPLGRSAHDLPSASNAAGVGDAYLYIGGYNGMAKVTMPAPVTLFD